MTFPEILQMFRNEQPITFYRQSEPHINYDLDGAEGVRFWSMNSETDELEEHSFSAEQIFATDWMIDSFDNQRRKPCFFDATWSRMAAEGKCDGIGGVEYRRIKSELEDFIFASANNPPIVMFGDEGLQDD